MVVGLVGNQLLPTMTAEASTTTRFLRFLSHHFCPLAQPVLLPTSVLSQTSSSPPFYHYVVPTSLPTTTKRRRPLRCSKLYSRAPPHASQATARNVQLSRLPNIVYRRPASRSPRQRLATTLLAAVVFWAPEDSLFVTHSKILRRYRRRQGRGRSQSLINSS